MAKVLKFEPNQRTIMRLAEKELEAAAQHASWEYKITAAGQFMLQLPQVREQWEDGMYED